MKAKAIKIQTEKKENSARLISERVTAAQNGAVITLEPQEYHLYGNDSPRAKYYITGCDSEIGDELSGITYLNKNLAIYVKGKHDITIDGRGALLLVHGEMTPFVIDNCRNVTIKNIAVDYVRATVSEMKVTEATEKYFVARVNTDSPFSIQDERILWEGDSFSELADTVQILDADAARCHPFPYNFEDFRAENLGNNLVKFFYPLTVKSTFQFAKKVPKLLKPGHILQVKHDLRTQAGAFITDSENVVFDNVQMHFMHGTGIAAQRVKNLKVQGCTFAPRPKTGRTNAAFGGFIDVNGASGTTTISDCSFNGCFDDAVKVHGTYLKLAAVISENILVLSFMGERTLGFAPFWRYDRIAFISPYTMAQTAAGVVEEVRLLNSRLVEIVLFDKLPKGVRRGAYVQNITAEPETLVQRCSFNNVGGNCVVANSSKKTFITQNEFTKCGGSGVLIAGGMGNPYESGAVQDVLIQKNKFTECGKAAVCVQPNPRYVLAVVHGGITIADNTFALNNEPAISVSNSSGVTVNNNLITGTLGDAPYAKFFSSKSVKVLDNKVKIEGASTVKKFMSAKQLTVKGS